MKGVRVDSDRIWAEGGLPTDSEQALATLENNLLAGDVSKQTHDTIAAQLEDPKISQRKLDDPVRPPNVSVIAGLLLGSPEFQREIVIEPSALSRQLSVCRFCCMAES